jgi:hypothetical protein
MRKEGQERGKETQVNFLSQFKFFGKLGAFRYLT